MREFARKSPTFWSRGTGKRLRGKKDAQIVADYLTSSPVHNAIGLYSVSMAMICNDTGLTVTEVGGALDVLAAEDFAWFDPDEEVVWVRTMVLWQFGIGAEERLKPEDNRLKAIVKEFSGVPRHALARSFYEVYGAQLGLPKPPAWCAAMAPFRLRNGTPPTGAAQSPSEGSLGPLPKPPLQEGVQDPLPGNSNSKGIAKAEQRQSETRARENLDRPSPEQEMAAVEAAPDRESSYDLFQRVWNELWSKKYGRPYRWSTNLGAMGEHGKSRAIGHAAREGDEEGGERRLRHWIASYLRDHGNRELNLDDRGHPVALLESRINSYGEPPKRAVGSQSAREPEMTRRPPEETKASAAAMQAALAGRIGTGAKPTGGASGNPAA